MTSDQRVWVTGGGFVTSLGVGRETVAGRLRRLEHGIRRYEPFEDPKYPIKLAAPVPGFETRSTDPEDWEFPAEHRPRLEVLRSLSPHGLYGWCALREALASASLAPGEISNPETGLYTASAGSPAFIHHNLKRMFAVGPLRCSPLGIVASVPGTLNFNLVAALKIKGVSCGFVSACASSGHALGFAFDEIRLGRQERMLVVGAEDCNPENILPFAAMRVLSQQTDPDRASRPFDRDRDGFVATGGAVALVLESTEAAEARGAVPWAEFCGWGQATDGYHVAIADPEGAGVTLAMRRALKSAGWEPGEIDYVNAHAPSTPIGDKSESHALHAVFSSAGAFPAISSTKALTGHGLSLGSILEAGLSILAMREGFTPANAHLVNLEPAAEGLNILRKNLPGPPRRILSNSSGFGGSNVSLLFREA